MYIMTFQVFFPYTSISRLSGSGNRIEELGIMKKIMFFVSMVDSVK